MARLGDDGEQAGPLIAVGGNLPNAEEDNGFVGIYGELLAGGPQHKRFVSITIWDNQETRANHRKGIKRVILGVTSVEPLLDQDDIDAAIALHDRVRGHRTGQVTLAGALNPEPRELPTGQSAGADQPETGEGYQRPHP